jgi:hypothetical protein
MQKFLEQFTHLHCMSGKGYNHFSKLEREESGRNVFGIIAISHTLEYPGDCLLSSYY